MTASPDNIPQQEREPLISLMTRAPHATTPPFACNYLPSHSARSLVIFPDWRLSPAQWGEYLRLGFRRSGSYIYRPACDACQACISVRIPIHTLTPNRSQRRAWDNQKHLHTQVLPLIYTQEHFDLYRRYQQARHPGGSMTSDDPDQYASFILDSTVESRLVEFRDNHNTLKIVALMDFSDDGASAVYTFYDPDGDGLGTFSILWQCDWLLQLGAPYLYLGYWIENSAKMRYKNHFKPQERFIEGSWRKVKASSLR